MRSPRSESRFCVEGYSETDLRPITLLFNDKNKIKSILRNITVGLQGERGETIIVRRRDKAIARIAAIPPEQPSPWPDLEARVQALYPDGVVSPSASDVLYEDRS